MLAVRNILFVPEYEYEDGGEPTNKLVIVLHSDNTEMYILQALVTSVSRVPETKERHGCTNNSVLSFFMFEAGRNIGARQNGQPFSFSKNTFITFRYNIKKILAQDYLIKYVAKGKAIEHIATLDLDEYIRLIKCAKNSSLINRQYKRKFEEVHNSIIPQKNI